MKNVKIKTRCTYNSNYHINFKIQYKLKGQLLHLRIDNYTIRNKVVDVFT